jgi:hypothetical protein
MQDYASVLDGLFAVPARFSANLRLDRYGGVAERIGKTAPRHRYR